MELDLSDKIVKITAKAHKIDLFKEPRVLLDFDDKTGNIRFIRNNFIHEDNGKLAENTLRSPRISYTITNKKK